MVKFRPRTSINDPTPMEGNPYWYSDANVFYAVVVGQTRPYSLPNCTCYAYGRYAEIREGFKEDMLPTGNAGTWFATAEAMKLPTGQEPRLGAVACYGYIDGQTGSHPGHVAIVETIQTTPTGDLKITTSNSDYGDNHDGTYWYPSDVYKSEGYRTAWMRNAGIFLQGFIYVDTDFINITIPTLCAILGNWWSESGLNPTLWESRYDPAVARPEDYDSTTKWEYPFQWVTIGGSPAGSGGFGLGQWTNTGGSGDYVQGRLYNLHTYVTDPDHQYGDGDGYGQLDFFLYENVWNSHPNKQRTTARSLEEFLNLRNASIDDMTYDFLICWEGLASIDYDDSQSVDRRNQAKIILEHIITHMADDPRTYEWQIVNNNYLDIPQRLNNAMVIYFWFLTNYNPQPYPIKTKKGMPVWMMIDYYFDM